MARESYELNVVADHVEEDPEIAALVSRMEEEADADLAPATVTLRWGKAQVAVVKRAAAVLGVPYQTYLKQAVFRQALADLARAEAVLSPAERRRDSYPPPESDRTLRRVAEDEPR